MARKKIVAGNWKMNMTPSQAVKLVEELKPLVVSDSVDVVYCVPAIDIVPVVEAVKGTNVQVGAENMYFEEKGAYTGEISAEMLVDAGVKYVVIGHSERRDYFKEDDVLLNKKVKKAIEAGLTPILCCGETLEQREMGVTLDWIRLQIKSDLAGVAAADVAACFCVEFFQKIGHGHIFPFFSFYIENDLSIIHHQCPITHAQCLLHIVSHHQTGGMIFLNDLLCQF